MLIVVEIILLAGALLAVSYPLWNKKFEAEQAGEFKDSELSDLLYRKDASFIALKDLEFDHKTGKVDDTDYDEMKTRFESEAFDTLKRIDDYNKTGNQGKTTVSENIETTVAYAPAKTLDDQVQTSDRFCVDCGAGAKASHKFCSRCGASLADLES